jgi:hypothetical protein
MLLIETRDLLNLDSTDSAWSMAIDLGRSGFETAIILAENAVLSARAGVSRLVADAIAAGVPISADELSLAERSIPTAAMQSGITAAGPELVVDQLESGAAVIWR